MENGSHAGGRRDGASDRKGAAADAGRPAPKERIEGARGSAVACVIADGALPAGPWLERLVAHTPAGVALVVVGPDAALSRARSVAGRELLGVALEDGGFAAACNSALRTVAAADLVLVASGTNVGAGWLERLRNAAHSDSHVATASALNDEAGLLQVALDGAAIDTAAAAVGANTLLLRPRIPSASGPCVYVRREAIELAGLFDPALRERDAVLADFSQRCVLRGLLHVAADDVLVAAAARTVSPSAAADSALVAERFPYYARETDDVARSVDRPIHSARRRALRALASHDATQRLSVTVDGRALGPLVAGTQVDTLETVRALAETGELALTVIVPPKLGAYARDVLTQAEVKVLRSDHELDRAGVADVVFRPYQVSSAEDLAFLRPLGDRLVMSCLDLIAYHNPGYFPAFSQWRRYQAATRIALALADRVIFSTHDCADEALAEQLVEPERISIVPRGIDHVRADGAMRRPGGLEGLGEREFLLCLGADYRHKNRVFAIELLAAMRDLADWPGVLLLAGPQLDFGASREEERVLLASDPRLAERVITLGPVSEAEKRWLLGHCVAVCYPTTREGFGFIPFEAAAYGRPCIFASTTALGELLPAELATITPWDPRASAERVLALLGDPARTAAHVAAIDEAGSALTWERNARGLIEEFRRAVAAPARDGARFADDLRDLARDETEIERKYNELWSGLSSAGHELVGPAGLLDLDDQALLLGVARRPLVRRAIFGQARLLRALRRRGEPPVVPPSTQPEDFELHFAFMNRLHMREQLARMPDLDELD